MRRIKCTNEQEALLSLPLPEESWCESLGRTLDLRRKHLAFGRLSKRDCNTFLGIPNIDTWAMYLNLWKLTLAEAGGSRCDLGKALLTHFRSLARAVRSGASEYADHLIDFWFRRSLAPATPGTRTIRTTRSIRRKMEFKEDSALLLEHWPEKLLEFYNTAVPAAGETGMASASVLRSGTRPRRETEPSGLRLSKSARMRFREFVRKWNVVGVRRDIVGRLQAAYALPVFYTDREGQGTYVFIPRGYSWSELTHDKDGEFSTLKDLLDNSYPLPRQSKMNIDELIGDAIRVYTRKLLREKKRPTKKGVLAYLDKHHRMGDEKQTRKYKKAFFKYFGPFRTCD